MNIQLGYSSAIVGALLLLVSMTKYNEQLALLYQITYVGIITSILNHMNTNNIAKYLDRFIMCVGTIIYVYYVFFIKSKPTQMLVFMLLSIAVSFYLLSKIIRPTSDIHSLELHDYIPQFSQNLHIVAQFIILFIFTIIIYNNLS